jgi:hypothetical protein
VTGIELIVSPFVHEVCRVAGSTVAVSGEDI